MRSRAKRPDGRNEPPRRLPPAAVLAICTLALAGVACGAARVGSDDRSSAQGVGYRVEHYLIQVAVDPEAKRARVDVTITARSTHRLRSLLFRFSGLDPSHLGVEYQSARSSRSGSLLRIVPERPVEEGRTFIVTAVYEGAVDEMLSGRVWTGNSAWYPLPMSPLARARYSLRVTVPKPLLVAGTGRLAEVSRLGTTRTFAWEINPPLPPGQVALGIGS